jgi:RNA polymerase sigma-70 factor (family 1)
MTVKKLYDEKVLFNRISDGDEAAFKIVFDLYKSKLYRYIFFISKSEVVAEELVHDVFLKLWTQQQLLIGVENPATYIYTIARNKAMDHLRKVARDKKLLDNVWNAIGEIHNETQEIIEANESDRLIKQAINGLTPQKQLIYQLSRDEGLNHEQIAEKLNISKSTVNNHLVESLKQIKAFLSKNSPELLVLFVFIEKFR